MDVRHRLRRAWSLRSNRPLLALISTLRGTVDNMRSVVWQPFALSLGIDMGSLGGLESTFDLTRISVQPFFGSASDAVGRKRFLMLRELLMIAAMGTYITAGILYLSSLLLLGIALVGLSFAVEPIWSTIVAESSTTDGLGMAYSVVYASYMAAGLFAPVTAGVLAASFGYTSVYYVSIGLGLVVLLIVALRLKETRWNRGGEGITLSRFTRALSEALRPPRHMWGFYLSMALDGISFGLGSRLLYGMLTRGYGYTPYMLSLLVTATTATWAVVQIPIGRVVDRFGYRRSLAVSQSISCFYLLALLMTQRFEVVLALQALLGFSAALWVPAEQAWIASNVEPEKRGQHMGSYSTFRGLLAFPAPLIGGVLFDAYGFGMPIMANLIGAVVDTILIAALIRDRVSAPETPEKS